MADTAEGAEQRSDALAVSVVIPCRNAAATLPQLLDSLEAQSFEGLWEIIAVDDGSSDGTRAVLGDYSNRLPLVMIETPPGPSNAARARNIGVAAARGDVVLFCDADDVMGDGWGHAMQEALKAHGFVQARVERHRLNQEPWVRSRRSEEGNEPPHRYWGSTPHSYTAVLGVQRSLHDAIGGMDESFATVEDVDYCWRLHRATGVALTYVPEAVVHMRYRTGWRDVFNQSRSWGIGVVHLYARHRVNGFIYPPPRHQLGVAGRAWTRHLARLMSIRDAGEFADWLFWFGYLVGWAEGSARYRVLLLYPFHDEESLLKVLLRRLLKSILDAAVELCAFGVRNKFLPRRGVLRLPQLVPHPRVRAYLERNFSEPLAAKGA